MWEIKQDEKLRKEAAILGRKKNPKMSEMKNPICQIKNPAESIIDFAPNH